MRWSRRLAGGVGLDVWTCYLAGADALSETLRQHVNMSHGEEQKWCVPEPRSRGVRHMEQVRVGRPFIPTGRRAAQRDPAGCSRGATEPSIVSPLYVSLLQQKSKYGACYHSFL